MSLLSKLIIVPCLLVLMALFMAANQARDIPDRLAAKQSIVLVDKQGRTKAELRLGEDGLPVLHLYGQHGTIPRLSLGVHGTASGLFLQNDQGKQRICISESSEKRRGCESGVFLFDEDGKGSLKMSTYDIGLPNLQLFDTTARPRFLLGSDSRDRIGLVLKGVDDAGRIELEVNDKNVASFKFFDANGGEVKERK